MAKKITQASWDCTEDGKLIGTFPGDLSTEFDLTELFPDWDDFNEAQMFYASYGVKQKSMDLSSDPKWTYEDKIQRAQELYQYAVTNGKMPKTERKGGFGISKKSIAEKIEKREVPLTDDQKALMRELGLMD